jgi:hypothetical protein
LGKGPCSCCACPRLYGVRCGDLVNPGCVGDSRGYYPPRTSVVSSKDRHPRATLRALLTDARMWCTMLHVLREDARRFLSERRARSVAFLATEESALRIYDRGELRRAVADLVDREMAPGSAVDDDGALRANIAAKGLTRARGCDAPRAAVMNALWKSSNAR